MPRIIKVRTKNLNETEAFLCAIEKAKDLIDNYHPGIMYRFKLKLISTIFNYHDYDHNYEYEFEIIL